MGAHLDITPLKYSGQVYFHDFNFTEARIKCTFYMIQQKVQSNNENRRLIRAGF